MSTKTMSTESKPKPTQAVTAITAADLPLHCPTDSMPLWSQHPKVYLDLDDHGHGKCPYCGTEYQITGPFKAAH